MNTPYNSDSVTWLYNTILVIGLMLMFGIVYAFPVMFLWNYPWQDALLISVQVKLQVQQELNLLAAQLAGLYGWTASGFVS